MEFTFHGANNKRYELSPMTLGDMRRFKEWVQMKPYADFQRVKDQLPPEEAQQHGSRILRECLDKRLTEGSPEVAEAQESVEGIVELLMLLLKKNHPTLTVEELEEAVTVANIKQVSEMLNACCSLGGNPSAEKNDIEFDLGEFYRAGLEAHLTPQQIDEITLPQWFALARASESSVPAPLMPGSADEARRLGFAVKNSSAKHN